MRQYCAATAYGSKIYVEVKIILQYPEPLRSHCCLAVLLPVACLMQEAMSTASELASCGPAPLCWVQEAICTAGELFLAAHKAFQRQAAVPAKANDEGLSVGELLFGILPWAPSPIAVTIELLTDCLCLMQEAVCTAGKLFLAAQKSFQRQAALPAKATDEGWSTGELLFDKLPWAPSPVAVTIELLTACA